jgi:hypothetical protein
MAFAMAPLIIQGISALAGSMANQGSKGMQMAPASESELAGGAAATKGINQFSEFTDLGPGAKDIKTNMSTQNELADMLRNFSQGGFLPGQQEFATANQFAQSAFQPQQVAINQQFQDEQLKANQMAARMGRPVNDPLIQAKLSQERQRAQERLGASQSAYVSEFAQSLPQKRLGYMGQLADLRSGLASQAMQNRQALVSMGSQLENSGRQFRLGSATQTSSSGGGTGGAIAGLLGGIGATKGGGFMDLFNSIGSKDTGGGGANIVNNLGAGYMNKANELGGDYSTSFNFSSPSSSVNKLAAQFSQQPEQSSFTGQPYQGMGSQSYGQDWNPMSMVQQMSPQLYQGLLHFGGYQP